MDSCSKADVFILPGGGFMLKGVFFFYLCRWCQAHKDEVNTEDLLAIISNSPSRAYIRYIGSVIDEHKELLKPWNKGSILPERYTEDFSI
jgi:hypothetical protein